MELDNKLKKQLMADIIKEQKENTRRNLLKGGIILTFFGGLIYYIHTSFFIAYFINFFKDNLVLFPTTQNYWTVYISYIVSAIVFPIGLLFILFNLKTDDEDEKGEK